MTYGYSPCMTTDDKWVFLSLIDRDDLATRNENAEQAKIAIGGPWPVPKAHRVKKKGKEAYRLPWSLGPFLLSAISVIRSIKKDIDEIVYMHIEDAFHHQRS